MSFFMNAAKGAVAAITGHHHSGSSKKAPFVPALIRSTEDQELLKQIEETHAADASQKLEVRPLFHLVEHIIARACHTIESGAAEAAKDNKSIGADVGISLDQTLLIERVSCEMGCKCLGGAKTHDVTVSILETLTQYTWEAKLVMVLAAFSVNYGEFLLLSQAYATNPLGLTLKPLKHLPSVVAQSEALKSQFETINKLVTVMIEVARLVVEFSEYPQEFRNQQEPLAIYWTIESAVAAATLINLIATHGDEYMPPRELEPTKFSHNIIFVRDNLEKFKAYVMQKLEEKKEEETYKIIRKTVFNMVHPDNLAVLKALIYSKDDILPLYDGTKRKRVPLDELKGKTALLLITGLDITSNELYMLKRIYLESKTHAYSIVWIPVVDRNIQWQSQFESAQSTMPWYSVAHPSIICSAVIRFITVDLNFKGKPILVALDDKGTISSTNAFNMMWIWKNNAFPITSTKEEVMWKRETWKLELLFDNLDQRIRDWIKEGKYIIVYGGDDLEWIKRFNKTAKDIVAAGKINLEMIYVGKSCKKEKVRKIITYMEAHKLGHYLKDTTDMWFFWTRLESMLHSKIQLDKADDDNDKVTQEIKKLLSYDQNVGAWAVMAKGSEIVLSGEGTTFHEVFIKYEEWKKRADESQFHIAFRENFPKIHKPEHCCRFEFPTTLGKIPEKMKCPECHNTMNVKITFVCCHDQNGGLMAADPKANANAAAPAT